MQAVVIGASGGIGHALASQLAERPEIKTVHATARWHRVPEHQKIQPIMMDLVDEDSIRSAAVEISERGAPSLILVASGLLSDGERVQPEKTYRKQSLFAMEQVFAINTFGPALVAKHMLPIMPRSGRAVFAAMSARVGSISDNRLGGWHAYRASKAALNMLIRNYAVEMARSNPDFIAASLHPGTVDTGLSKPFQGNVPDGKLFSPDQSAGYLLDVIDNLSPAQSGRAFDWAGKEIPA